MAAIHVVTDGTVALPDGAAEAAGITIVPQNVILEGKTYRAGIDITTEQIYERLGDLVEPARSSQASPGQFLETYREVLAWGVEIVSLHLPRQLSGTVNSAEAAVGMLPGDAPVTVVETGWASSALGLVSLRAAEAGGEGATREEVVELVEGIGAVMNLVFVVDDLQYLRRSGRIGAAQSLVGSLLKVKPILELKDSTIVPLERVRTTGRALQRLAAIVGERLDWDRPTHVGLISGQADAEAAALATFLENRHRPSELWIAPCDPTVALHTGPGVFGAAFYASPSVSRSAPSASPR